MSDLPHSLKSEAGLIGGMLQDGIKIVPFCRARGLSPMHFYDKGHQVIYAAIEALCENDRPVDVVTVGDALKQKNRLDEIGGERYLADFIEQCPVLANCESYLDTVLDTAAKRRIIEQSALIPEMIQSDRPAADVLKDLIEKLNQEHDRLTAGDVDPFPCIRLDDLQTYDTPPDQNLVGDGWLRRGAGCLLTGGTGLGKSVLAEQIAVSVAAGVNILGRLKVHSPYRVLYVEAENDTQTLQRDILSLVANAAEKPCPILVRANLWIHHVYGMTGADFSAWLNRKAKRVRPDLIVIDPYQAYLSGLTDINSTASFLSWIHPIERIIRDHNCALLLVTHTPKPKDRESWTQRDSVYMAAGTSAISNWARASCELTAAGDEDGRYRLRFGKNAERTGYVDEAGRIVRDIYIEHSGNIKEPFWRVSEDQSVPLPGKQEQVKNAIEANQGKTDGEIARLVGCDRSTVYRARKKMAS